MQTGKADKSEIPDVSGFETTAHAAETYATKTELTDGLASKADSADIADMLTKSEAAGTYADKLSVYTLENTVEAQRDRINNLDTNKADKTQIITVTSGTGTLFLADDGTYKPAAGDPPDLSAYLTKTEAASTYTPLTTSIAQAASIVELGTKKADKTEIITVSNGDGSRFLANDGTYKSVQVDPPDLTPYLTKTEAGETYETQTHAVETYATKAEVPDVSGFETTAHASATYATKTELTEGLAGKVDTADIADMLTKTEAGTTYATKTELADKADSATVTALSGVVTEHTTSISALETGKADKSELPIVDSTLIPDSPNPVSNAAVVTGFATYGTQIEQLNAQVVANAEAIEGLESSKADVGDIPDVSGFETTAHAEATYATKTELEAKADRTQLQGYLTRLEASETYETIARASKIKSLTAAGHAVTVTDEGLANVGGTKVLRTTETPQIGVSNVSIAVQQILPATEEEATTGEGETLPIAYTSTTSGALTEYSNFTIDGVPIATKDDLTASESPIKAIAAVTSTAVFTPNSDGVVTIGQTIVRYSAGAVSPGQIGNIGYIISQPLPEGIVPPAGSITPYATFALLWDVSNTKKVNFRIATDIYGTERIRLVTHDEFTEQSSPIKSISQVRQAITPDASGNVNIPFVYIAAGDKDGKKTLFVRRASDNINFGDQLFIEFAENGGKQSDCEMYAQTTDETTQGDKINPVRIATKDELTTATTDMATQTWVQQYIASLDGTNMKF